MCSGAILWPGIPYVIFGTLIETLKRFDLPQIGLLSAQVTVRASSPFRRPKITGGVLEKECDALFEEMARRVS